MARGRDIHQSQRSLDVSLPAIDTNGDTVEFGFSERRNLVAAKRFLRKALKRHGRPERIVIDGSQTNRDAIMSCDAESRLQAGLASQAAAVGVITALVVTATMPALHAMSAHLPEGVLPWRT
jgi:hypothetical protein